MIRKSNMRVYILEDDCEKKKMSILNLRQEFFFSSLVHLTKEERTRS